MRLMNQSALLLLEVILRHFAVHVSRVRFLSVVIYGLSLLLILALLRGFFSGFYDFLPSNSNLTRIEEPHENQLSLMWLPL